MQPVSFGKSAQPRLILGSAKTADKPEPGYVNASEVTASTQTSFVAEQRRARRRSTRRTAAWVLGVPAVLLILLYVVLLITPLPLPFANSAARAMIMSVMPPSADLELGDVALAVENGVAPVIRFDSVALNDRKSGARIRMDALELGFSPLRALVGQPGAVITLVAPHIQLVQDLFGPRAARFEFVPNAEGGQPIVRVLEGEDAFPPIGISAEGISRLGPGTEEDVTLRSNNDWLIHNLQSSEQAVADLLLQAEMGRFSRLRIRDGTVGMIDSVYGLYRRFEDITLDIAPAPIGDTVEGKFSARVAGKVMNGSVLRTIAGEDRSRLEIDMTSIDFASLFPFLDDPTSMIAVRGTGAMSMDITFDTETSLPVEGDFKVDLTGLDLRIADDSLPIASSILDVNWSPESSRFTLSEGAIRVGQSSARVSGVFAMGLDTEFGPTIGMSIEARQVSIDPPDMDAPAEPFDEISLSGWSAPLYGALGIDRMVARRGDGFLEASGRMDMLIAGLGLDLEIHGAGVTADDLKRLWPHLAGTESRDWFVANVPEGRVESTSMYFDFPVGTLELEGNDDEPLPEGSMSVDIVGSDVSVRPTPEMDPVAIEGEVAFRLRDNELSVSAAGAALGTAKGAIAVDSPTLVMDYSDPDEMLLELSGDIAGEIPAILAFANAYQPGLLDGDLPVDPSALSGQVKSSVLATMQIGSDDGTTQQIDYVLNGSVSDFASADPIEMRRIDEGELTFSASQERYVVAGTAHIDGIEAHLEIVGEPEQEPRMRVAATVSVEELAEFGFDASAFMEGEARFIAQPGDDGELDVAVDLQQAGIDVSDLGISKAVGVPGTLRAVVEFGEDTTRLSTVELAFEDVYLEGEMAIDAASGLESADFTTFALSEGDRAEASLVATDAGYEVTLRGTQLDMKPMLGRLFALDEGAGGVGQTQFDQRVELEVELDRAIGFYGTTAFNVDVDLSLSGADLTDATVSASFGEGNALSVSTNPTPQGRLMSVAFNDAGTVLRFTGVYSQLAGGEGSLTLNRDRERDLEVGDLRIRNFAIVDEDNVAQILGNHSDSRTLISAQNRLDFNNGRVSFVRRDDSVQVTDAVLSGDLVGGTMQGYIYTDSRQYDLTGTYVPLFGLNNAFQQIPIFGPLLGGRDGEGLVGVTFAVRGPLDNPQFQINPLSALVPGVFRELFEFRSQGQPATE